MFDAGDMDELRVWYMPPKPVDNTSPKRYTFPWAWATWVQHKRLIVKAHRKLTGSMGSAEFKLLRSTFSDNDPRTRSPFTWDDSKLPLVAGCYICVTAGPLSVVVKSNVIDINYVKWFGFIDVIDTDQLAVSGELIGSVNALEMGHLLDRIKAKGWKRASADNYALQCDTPDSANIKGQLDGQIVGNAVKTTNDGNSNTVYLFQNDPSLCDIGTASKLFTRWRLIKHFQYYCLERNDILMETGSWDVTCLDNSQADDPTPSTTTIAGYLNQTATPEVFQLKSNISCKGMLDLLLARNLALGWYIWLKKDTDGGIIPSLRIYTLSDSTTYGLPSFASYAKSVDLSKVPTVNFHTRESSVDVPDEIIVEGNNIIFGFTAGYYDQNIVSGWAPAPETAFRAGATAGAGYAGLTDDDKLERNRAIRQSSVLSDVYSRFALAPIGGPGSGVPYDLSRYTTPGNAGGSTLPVCPEVSYDPNTSTLTLSPYYSRSPYLPTATLCRTLPWIDGYDNTGTDQRPALLKAWPNFSRPMLFYYDNTGSIGNKWLDLLSKGGKRSAPSFDVDDRGAAFRAQYSPQERLGWADINLAADGRYDVGQSITQFTEGVYGFDWRKLVATIAIASDQKISYRVRRPGVDSDAQVRNTITITDNQYNLYVMHAGSIVGINKDGQPSRVAGPGPGGSVIVRNDFPALVAHANRVAAFSFRSRKGFRWVGMRPDSLPAFADIGIPVSTIQEAPDFLGKIVTGTYNTVVEKVECTYGDQPRATIEADMPAAPNTGAPVSPSGGGPVSVTLNGTVSQAVQQAGGDINGLAAANQRTPLHVQYSPSTQVVLQSTVLLVGGGNTLYTSTAAGTIVGVKTGTGGTITSVPTTLPVSGSTYADGLGYAYTVNNDGTPSLGSIVWVVNRPMSDGTTTVTPALGFTIPGEPTNGGAQVISLNKLTLPVSGGGTATVYALDWA